MNIDLLIVFVASTSIMMCIFLIIKKCNKKQDDSPFWIKIIISITGGVIITMLSVLPIALNDVMDGIENRMTELKNENYRYTKQITADTERKNIINEPSYARGICNNSEYKIVNKGYHEININSHLFYEKTTYLFCKDENKHANKVSNISLNDYQFVNKFLEYRFLNTFQT